MKRPINWVAASIFFLAGSILYERLVPESLTNLAFLAYIICVIIVGWPQLELWFNAWFAGPSANPVQSSREPETPPQA